MVSSKLNDWVTSIQASMSIVELKDTLNSILVEIDNLPHDVKDEDFIGFFDIKVWRAFPKFSNTPPVYSPSHDMKFTVCGRACIRDLLSYDDESILYYSDDADHEFRLLNVK